MVVVVVTVGKRRQSSVDTSRCRQPRSFCSCFVGYRRVRSRRHAVCVCFGFLFVLLCVEKTPTSVFVVFLWLVLLPLDETRGNFWEGFSHTLDEVFFNDFGSKRTAKT